jgi:hypothetical protein
MPEWPLAQTLWKLFPYIACDRISADVIFRRFMQNAATTATATSTATYGDTHFA